MTKRHIVASDVNRDRLGFWTHPALRPSAIVTQGDLDWWLRLRAMDAWVVTLARDNPRLYRICHGRDGWDVSLWMPTPPPERGWFMGAIQQGDTGPECLWLKPVDEVLGGPKPSENEEDMYQ